MYLPNNKGVVILLCMFCCSAYGQLVYGKNYVGLYKRSIWEYEFYNNETFWYRSQGRGGNKECTGHFQLVGDTLVLNAVRTDTIAWQFENLENKKLLMLPDTCLLDLGNGYDYCAKYFSSYGDSLVILPSQRRAKPNKAFRKNK